MSSDRELDNLFSIAKTHFMANRYDACERILNQLILQNYKNAESFHMLGTIYYDKGKFNKAIRSFRRALDIDPAFTDASVGLSIILNDLGRYEEGQEVFTAARQRLSEQTIDDPYVNEKLALKHDEMGELYFQHQRYKDALEQYFKAIEMSARKPELTLKIVDCHLRLKDTASAIRTLRDLLNQYPHFSGARLSLGKIYFDQNQVTSAIEQWEQILANEPDNLQAREYLALAHATPVTSIDQMEI